MPEPPFLSAADAFDVWRDDVLRGAPPVLYPVGTGELSRIQIGPGLVTLLGGAPGAGKTAFAMQCVLDALRLSPDLRAVVCNVEMTPAVLLDRQLARLSGVDLSTIRHRRLGEEHAERIESAMDTLKPLAERLAFVPPPFDLKHVADAADGFGAKLLLLDYIQRIAPPGEHADKRGSVNATMDHLRRFVDAGYAVVVVSAVGRTRDKHGRSSYAGDGLNLASFRESSELEFGCDDAFILIPDEAGEAVTLRHLKSRHGDPRDLALSFDRTLQRFAPAAKSVGKGASKAGAAKIKSEIAALWNKTAPASEDEKESEA